MIDLILWLLDKLGLYRYYGPADDPYWPGDRFELR